jgi:serine protease Do
MSKKSVLTSIALITIGIIFGVLLVSNLNNGISVGFARADGEVKLGGPVPVTTQNQALKALNEGFTQVAKSVTPSVVTITATTSGKKSARRTPDDWFHRYFSPDGEPPEEQPSQGMGSGVIITADGYIATNNHVVSEADKDGIDVVLNDKVKYKAKLVGTDPTTDLAVVKIDAKNLPVAALGNSENVQIGEWVLAIGNPLGLTSTVTAGIVSALGRSINIIRQTEGRANYGIEDFIQTDAAINPGNSGGALVNMNGEVIGINSAIATSRAGYEGYGFAVPVNILKTVAEDLIRYGEVRRGYIGVTIETMDQTKASAVGMKETKGVLIQSVVKGGAGESAGLKELDVVLAIDNKEVNASNELQSYIATKHVGDVVTVKLFREGKTLEKKVTLKPREDKATTSPKKPEVAKNDDETETGSPKTLKVEGLGMSIRALTAEEKKELGLEKGVLVTEVKRYGEADSRFLRPNQIILEADRKDVSSPSDLKKILDARKPGDSILLRVRQDDKTTNFVAVQIPK